MTREFDDYVAASAGRLLRLAWLLTGNTHDAEDLAQTALVRLCEHWSRVSRSEDLDAYTRRVLVNASHSRFRRHRVTQVPLDLARAQGRPDPGLTVVEDRAGIAVALASLPRRQREVVVLRYLEDLSEAETAGILGCSLGTVKSSASRGLDRLRIHPALHTFIPATPRGEA